MNSSDRPGRPARFSPDAVLFDLGYTLVYFEPDQELIVQDALREIGVQRSTDEILAAVRHVFGDYYRDASTATFPATPEHDRQVQSELERRVVAQMGAQVSAGEMARYSDILHARYDRPGAIRQYPEVAEVLRALRERGYRLGIVSNWSWNLRKRAAQAGLEEHFELVWGSAYAGCNKPNPAIFQQALARLQPPVPAGRALYVGDSYWHDVAGARGAGLQPVLLDRAGTADAPDCPVIRDLRGLLDLL